MVGWNKIGHFRESSHYRELLNDAMDVNSPHTNNNMAFMKTLHGT